MIRAWLFLIALAGLAHADGGTLRISQSSGPFILSVFTAPEPLRVGPADVSALVQTRDGNVILDATIALHLVGPDGVEQQLPATHANATNQLLQAATVDLRVPGRWRLEAIARRDESEATVSCTFDVEESAPRLQTQWPALALPVACLLLFACRQQMRRRHRS